MAQATRLRATRTQAEQPLAAIPDPRPDCPHSLLRWTGIVPGAEGRKRFVEAEFPEQFRPRLQDQPSFRQHVTACLQLHSEGAALFEQLGVKFVGKSNSGEPTLFALICDIRGKSSNGKSFDEIRLHYQVIMRNFKGGMPAKANPGEQATVTFSHAIHQLLGDLWEDGVKIVRRLLPGVIADQATALYGTPKDRSATEYRNSAKQCLEKARKQYQEEEERREDVEDEDEEETPQQELLRLRSDDQALISERQTLLDAGAKAQASAEQAEEARARAEEKLQEHLAAPNSDDMQRDWTVKALAHAQVAHEQCAGAVEDSLTNAVGKQLVDARSAAITENGNAAVGAQQAASDARAAAAGTVHEAELQAAASQHAAKVTLRRWRLWRTWLLLLVPAALAAVVGIAWFVHRPAGQGPVPGVALEHAEATFSDGPLDWGRTGYVPGFEQQAAEVQAPEAQVLEAPGLEAPGPELALVALQSPEVQAEPAQQQRGAPWWRTIILEGASGLWELSPPLKLASALLFLLGACLLRSQARLQRALVQLQRAGQAEARLWVVLQHVVQLARDGFECMRQAEVAESRLWSALEHAEGVVQGLLTDLFQADAREELAMELGHYSGITAAAEVAAPMILEAEDTVSQALELCAGAAETENQLRQAFQCWEEGEDLYMPGGYHPVKLFDSFGPPGDRSRYTVQGKLGWGASSTVWRVSHANGQDYALKVSLGDVQAPDPQEDGEGAESGGEPEQRHEDVERMSRQNAEGAERERKILRALHHRPSDEQFPATNCNVVELVDCFSFSGPHGKHSCLVFEMLGQPLLRLAEEYWDSERRVPLDRIRRIARQTLQYRAPEAIAGQPPYTPAADIFSTGCMLSEIMLGEHAIITPPYDNRDLSDPGEADADAWGRCST
ncbi:hypothetical protein WJX73_005536 [Symbiochloris irregularis]|uniref:non-specific serine/threonine protein kinase n=1 Tax=Symbiochloris irregularis TaxID=706552 RepID=A0AAW1NVI3_9CHLO